MASAKSQRIGIWVIAVIMVLGTIGSFVVIILSNQNAAIDAANTAKTNAAAAAQQTAEANANAANSAPLAGYSSRTFDPSSVTSLGVETLVQGTGATLTASDTVNVSYFGYLHTGVIFDSSTKKSPAGDTPISLSLSNVIAGWTQGLTGVKVGSVVRLTIPSNLGYGATAQGAIPANSPLEFIIEVHSVTAAS
jgi:FKBP-type peptidyl-prolyl cis-trans isomerase